MPSSAVEFLEWVRCFEEVWKGQQREFLCFSMGVLNRISKEEYNSGVGDQTSDSEEKIVPIKVKLNSP